MFSFIPRTTLIVKFPRLRLRDEAQSSEGEPCARPCRRLQSLDFRPASDSHGIPPPPRSPGEPECSGTSQETPSRRHGRGAKGKHSVFVAMKSRGPESEGMRGMCRTQCRLNQGPGPAGTRGRCLEHQLGLQSSPKHMAQGVRLQPRDHSHQKTEARAGDHPVVPLTDGDSQTQSWRVRLGDEREHEHV